MHTWHISKTFLQYLEVTNLINIAIKLLNKIRIEIERQLALHIIQVYEMKDCL